MHTSLTTVTLQSNQARQVVSEPKHLVPLAIRLSWRLARGKNEESWACRLNLMWGKWNRALMSLSDKDSTSSGMLPLPSLKLALIKRARLAKYLKEGLSIAFTPGIWNGIDPYPWRFKDTPSQDAFQSHFRHLSQSFYSQDHMLHLSPHFENKRVQLCHSCLQREFCCGFLNVHYKSGRHLKAISPSLYVVCNWAVIFLCYIVD